MVKVKNFNEGLEQSLAKLGQEVLKQRETLQRKELPEREIVKDSIKSLAKETVPQEEKESRAVEPEKNGFLPSYTRGSGLSAEVAAEISALVRGVFSEGLEKTLREAKKRSPFVEDAFHDALTDKLLPELKKRKII